IDNLDSLQRLVSTTSTQLPYSSLEWSPAKAKSDRIKTSSWMPAFLNAAYQDKVSLSDWNDFMDSLNYDPTFLQEAYCEMDRANFIHACYAGLIQFGAVGELDNQIFSTCALLTNSTVDPISAGEYHPNEPFYTLFQSIAPCPPASSGPEPTAEPIGFALFPNPAGHVVNISGDGIISNVRLFSVDGKLMFSDATAVNQYQLDLSDFKPGVYVVHINQTHSLKLIKT
ncbi:MAG: T9SS type A sorting domain-containing protein, partial [Bacteroidota bacterium]